MIEARGISVAIGRRTILRDVEMVARAGEITAIVGPNGSGKSTLVKAIAGELEHRGTIRLAGTALTDLKPWQAAEIRAVLPQATALSFPFTVREVVALGLTAGRHDPVRDMRLPEQALARVDLDGFAGRFYQELSGGEQQRVQLARVLCQVWEPVVDGRPRWLILDEPVSSLDIRHQLMTMQVARDFARQGGGVLTVLHDLNLTAMFAAHVVMMQEGRVAAAGTPAAVLRDDIVSDVFGCALRVGAVPAPGIPFLLPHCADAG